MPRAKAELPKNLPHYSPRCLQQYGSLAFSHFSARITAYKSVWCMCATIYCTPPFHVYFSMRHLQANQSIFPAAIFAVIFKAGVCWQRFSQLHSPSIKTG